MHRALANRNFFRKEQLGRSALSYAKNYRDGAMPRLLSCFCRAIFALRPPETLATLFVLNTGVKLVSKETA